MKTYVLIIPTKYPKNHQLAGDRTEFPEKILNGLHNTGIERKIHIIEENYRLWKGRFEEISQGNAQISLRYWSGAYNSKQITICNLTKADGIGLQKLRWDEKGLHVDKIAVSIDNMAKNDGLAKGDLYDWIKPETDLALIHFTPFRYTMSEEKFEKDMRLLLNKEIKLCK